jgi:hypothetical protein
VLITCAQVPLRERLKGAPLDAVELIEQMLQCDATPSSPPPPFPPLIPPLSACRYNPASRPDARKCLCNVYFRNAPQPTAAADLPMSALKNE